MKTLIRSLTVCALVMLGYTGAISAQDPQSEVSAGSIAITFDPAYLNYLAEHGITVTFGKPDKPLTSFKTVSGTLDDTTGAGEVTSYGKLTMTSGSIKVEFMTLVLDTADPQYPVFSVMVTVNDVFQGRHRVFTVISGEPYSLPLKQGKNTSMTGYFKGQSFLKYFQLASQPGDPLVGSFVAEVTLAKDDGKPKK